MSEHKQAFPHVLRLALGLMLLGYGATKIAGLQFQEGAEYLARPAGQLRGMEMVWAFFAFSRGYELSVGLVEATVAALLLVRRTAALGALAYLAVMVNVVLIDFWYGVDRLPTAMACTLLLGILAWMWLERVRYWDVLNRLLASPEEMSSPMHAKRFLLPVLAVALIYVTGATLLFLCNPIFGPLRQR